jgi:asparagine synthase (glutamine-hydrolysing)
MVGMLTHRGPDEYGLYRDAHAAFVHARLSIIDLSTGQQPLSNEDQTLWIVFNGEIFNFIELRKELESLGHIFKTRSDTEVIVHAYESWGDGCFPRLNGQWALALWDSTARRLVLSRDRIGVRPLYVHEHEGRVRFASEVKALFADPEVPRAIDLRGIDQTFTYWTPIAPVSVFRNIEEIRPASVRVYEADGTKREWTFWSPSYPSRCDGTTTISIHEATEGLRERLMKATQLRMVRADVPVGSYLSGGLDSSLIAWMGRKAKEGEFRTFSIRFEDAEYDETVFQRTMAATLSSSHREIVVRRADIANAFPDVIYHTERPVLRTAAAPLFLLSRLVRDEGIKAVLTGEGADEMLAGYDLFKEAAIRSFWASYPDSKMRPKLFDRLYPYLARSPQQTKGLALEFWRQGLDRAGQPGFSHDPRWRTTSSLKKFFSREVQATLQTMTVPSILETLPHDFGSWDILSQAQYLEVGTLLSGYLISSQGDRMLMAHSVEGRFPFLDVEVMEYCNSLPPQHKLLGLNEKFVLKRVAKGIIPDSIINRPKQPYRAPDAISFVSDGSPEYVAEMLSDRAVKEAAIFDTNAVRGLYKKCLEQSRTGNKQGNFSNIDNMGLVGILSTQLLYHQLVASHRNASPVEFTTYVDRVLVDARYP